MHRDIVLFVGAGFSVDAGLPVMARFGVEAGLDHFNLRRHAEADPSSATFRHMAPELVRAAERYERFRDQCAASGVLSRDEWDNIETLFSVIDALEKSGAPEVNVYDEIAPLEVYRRAVALWVWKIYQQLPVLLAKSDKTNPFGYQRLFEFVRATGIADRLTVVTTNYDIVYEWESYSHGVPCLYPIEWVPENGGVTVDGEHWVHPADERTSGTLVCKLHGSVNYFESKDLFIVGSDLSTSKPIGKSHFAPGRPAVAAVDSLHALRQSFADQDLGPVIIPPSYDKSPVQDWHKKTLNRTLHALHEARVIGFIGYSLPQTDGFISSLIAGATAFRGSAAEPPKIFVVDPSADVHARYRRLFGDLVSGPGPMTFGEASTGHLQRELLPFVD